MREKRSISSHLLERYCDLPPSVRDKTDGVVRRGIGIGRKLKTRYNPKIGERWVAQRKAKLRKTIRV